MLDQKYTVVAGAGCKPGKLQLGERCLDGRAVVSNLHNEHTTAMQLGTGPIKYAAHQIHAVDAAGEGELRFVPLFGR